MIFQQLGNTLLVRVIALFISLLIDLPWVYFLFEMTVLNAMLVYMIYTHEQFCKRFMDEL